MTDKKENYQTKRIDDLEDDRVEKLASQIDEIHNILVRNGLIADVKCNKQRSKLTLWLVSVLFAAVIGGIFGGKINIPAVGDEFPGITIDATGQPAKPILPVEPIESIEPK